MKIFEIKNFWTTKKRWGFFLFCFFIFFFIFNWDKFSWIFNYKAVSIYFSNFFGEKTKITKENQVQVDKNKTLISDKKENKINRSFEYSEKENILEIPRIEISAPFFFVDSQNEKKILETLDRGLVIFSDFALPGEEGKTIILGHSARHNWPKSNPVWVFTYLKEAGEGDEVILHFNHRKYRYLISRKFIMKEGEDFLKPLTNSENVLLLITCWPPGNLRNKERLAVEAVLQIK